jgi:hypothetical protein
VTYGAGQVGHDLYDSLNNTGYLVSISCQCSGKLFLANASILDRCWLVSDCWTFRGLGGWGRTRHLRADLWSRSR